MSVHEPAVTAEIRTSAESPDGHSPTPSATDNRAPGWSRYCAPLRCYCGKCPSWTPLPDVAHAAARPVVSPRVADSWANREEATWIDEM